MQADRRQVVLLGAILAVLAGVLYWNSSRAEPTPEEFSAAMGQRGPGAAGALDTAPASPAGARAPGPLRIPAVQLASLDQTGAEPADSGRDPFRFELAAAGGGGQPGRGASAAPVQPVAPALPQEPPGPPPIPLKFIGIAKQGEGRMFAVLRDDRGVYYGAEGDVVEGRDRIIRVLAARVELSYVDGRGRVSIPMSGGRP